MATKTPNFNLNKTELTDTIQSTILANNENFAIIDEALKSSGEAVVIPYEEIYVAGTEEYTKYSEMIMSCFDENNKYIKNLYLLLDNQMLLPCIVYVLGSQTKLFQFSTTFVGTSLVVIVTITEESIIIDFDTAELQTKLTFDSTPTQDSTNPVTSGGVKKYIDDEMAKLSERIVALEGGAS